MTGSSSISEPVDGLASAGRTLLASKGLRGLTLRAVAHSAGTTLNALSYHAGDKVSLVQRILELDLAERQAVHARWLARADALRPLDTDILAQLIGAYLDEAITTQRDSVLAIGELLLAGMRDPLSAPGLAQHFAQERSFWQAMVRDRPAADMLGHSIAAYCQDEALFTVALGHKPDYRLLRAATIKRLAEGFCGHGAGIALRFDVLIAAMEALSGQAARPLGLEPSSKRAIMAGHAADVLIEQGVAALTHRVVAAQAGAPNSSVAHHFRTRDDLIQAGIEGLYLRMQDDVAGLREKGGDLARDSSGMAVLRATHAVALEATRNPHFLPFAADMRRQRAINVREAFAQRIAGDDGLDGAAVQAIVILLVGMAFSTQAGDDASLPNVEARLDWIAALRAASAVGE